MADYIVQNDPALVDDTINKVQNLKQTIEQETDQIMSQKACTDMIKDTDSTALINVKIDSNMSALPEINAIRIGTNPVLEGYPAGNQSIYIGATPSYIAVDNITSVGMGSSANLPYSCAVGSFSAANEASVVSVGSGTSNSNYGKRRIVNVKDPVNAQDAATKNYVDVRVPVPPTTGTFTLQSAGGIVNWVSA